MGNQSGEGERAGGREGGRREGGRKSERVVVRGGEGEWGWLILFTGMGGTNA